MNGRMRAGSAAPELRQGIAQSAAVIVAYAPFGLALGATLAATHVPPWIAWSSSPLLFGGAAQLVAVTMLDRGAGALLVVLAALVVNARMLLYSASLAPHAADWPRRWRWVGAYLLADPVYALAIERFGRAGGRRGLQERLAYYLAVGVTLWIGWQVLTGAGVLLAGVLPVSQHLDLAAPLTFLLLLVPMLTNRAAYAAAGVGAVVALVAAGLPLGLGLLVGAGAGVAAGALLGGRRA
jgi:predicted branched-subunit amino acid permease